MKKILIFISLLFSFICQSQEQQQIVKGKVQSETSKAILQNVHVLNLTKVKGTITNNEGEFEINAKLKYLFRTLVLSKYLPSIGEIESNLNSFIEQR